MSTKLLEVDTPIVPLKEVKRFITDCMIAVGTPKSHAEALADLLVEADYRGHYSHGMNRLGMYIEEVRLGLCDPSALPNIIKESCSTVLVDGQNGLGAVVGNYCMRKAIEKAKETRIGIVVAKGSNHYGIAGMYVLQALKEGLIGMTMTNTSPCMVPTRAKKATLGTNPIAFGAPAENNDSLLLDMATTTVALGKVEMQRRKNEAIPEGWAQDPEGNILTDPNTAYLHQHLSPLGGHEENASYKGYGLALMVEVLCGVLGGASFGPSIRKYSDLTSPANLGHCFIAINPQNFCNEFSANMSSLANDLRKLEPIKADKPVLVPGDPEKLHMRSVDEAGGVRYVKDQLDSCDYFAKSLKVHPLQPL